MRRDESRRTLEDAMKIPSEPRLIVELFLMIKIVRSVLELIKEWYALPASFRTRIGSRLARAGSSLEQAIVERWQARGKPSRRRVRIATWVHIVSGPVLFSAWFYLHCGVTVFLGVTRPVGGVKQLATALLAIGFFFAAEWYRGDARFERARLQDIA